MKDWKYIEGAKTGNGVFSIFKSDKPIKMKSPQGAIVTINPDGTAAHQDKEGSQMAVHPHNSFKEAVEYYKSQGYVKVSNESLGEYMAKKPRVINEEKTGAEEFFKKLSDDVKEREEKNDADIEKVGNLSKDELLKELDAEEKLLKVLKERGGEKGYGTTPILYRDAERRIQDLKNKLKQIGNKVGNKNLNWDTGTIDWDVANFNGKWYITKNGQKLKGPFSSMQEAERYLDGHKWELQDKYGNAKTGNLQYHKVGKISIRLEANDDDWTVYDADGNELKSGKGGLGRAKTWAEHFARFTNKKTANSAKDDKFSYVMREFDAGKLKTPDGKVVTDPAQAKAIAYSESKKTENGLARARNAIKKS